MSAPKISLLKPRFLVVAYLDSNVAVFILGISIGISIGNNPSWRMLSDTND